MLIALLAIAGFYLVTEQTAHVLGAFPYVLLGVILLLHPFFHAGHGGHDEPGETTHPVRDADHEEHHSRHTKGEKP